MQSLFISYIFGKKNYIYIFFFNIHTIRRINNDASNLLSYDFYRFIIKDVRQLCFGERNEIGRTTQLIRNIYAKRE